jgi:hypothetical protein
MRGLVSRKTVICCSHPEKGGLDDTAGRKTGATDRKKPRQTRGSGGARVVLIVRWTVGSSQARLRRREAKSPRPARPTIASAAVTGSGIVMLGLP